MVQRERPERVLIVEDEPIIRLALEEDFEEHGYAVDGVGTCTDAILKLTGNSYFGAVIDVGLPDGRGDTLCDTLRRISPGLPIVLCTGYGLGELRCDAFADGRIVVVPKPALAAAIIEGMRAAEGQTDISDNAA